MDRFCVHSRLPSGSLTSVSLQITAALPLSQISVNRVTARAEPDGGSGPGTSTRFAGVQHLAQLDVDAGKFTVGGLVMWKVAATLPNVGSTCGVSSTR